VIHRPCSLRRGGAVFPFRSPGKMPRGWSAARRNILVHAFRRVHPLRRVRALRRSITAFFSPRRPCFLAGAPEKPFGSSIRAAPATLRVPRIQPLKAALRSGGGRLAGASRARGYEPRPQAPHLIPSTERLATTPPAEPSRRDIAQGCGFGNTVSRNCDSSPMALVVCRFECEYGRTSRQAHNNSPPIRAANVQP
jgi:hypothetical protein